MHASNLVPLSDESLPVSLQAGLSDTRTLEEVQELEQALKTLIYRAGGIRKAKSSRSKQATQMIFRADEDIPYEVMVNPTGSVEAGAHAYLAKQEKLALDQLNPTAKDLAVGAGSQLITPAIRQQLPLCVHKVRRVIDIFTSLSVCNSVVITCWCTQPSFNLDLHAAAIAR